jgi:hypothetical protein
MTMRTGLMRTLALTAVLTAACGSVDAPATGNDASASRATQSEPASGAVQQARCTASHHCLALVTLSGSNVIVVRDITDIAHPKTVGTVGQVPAPQFASGSLITYADGTDMWSEPIGGSANRMPPPFPGIGGFAWSPDGNALVFVHGDAAADSGMDVSLWTRGGGFTALGSIPPRGVGGCETYASCTLPNWMDFQLHFSPDGTLISLVIKSFSGTVFRIWSADGKLLEMDDSYGATMSAWSGQALYLRAANGVSVWRNKSVSTLLGGVAWIRPSASPGGGAIVYSVRDSAGWAHTYVVDTATGSARELKTARTNAMFLTSRYIWYEGERDCQPADQCGASPAIHPLSGKAYIYDLQDGTETESIITRVYDVWPHAA